MADSNENIVEELTSSFKETQFEPESSRVPADDDSDVFHDVESGDVSESSNSVTDSDNLLDSEDEATPNPVPELTLEEIEERKQLALELKERGNSEFRVENHHKAIKLYCRALKACPLGLPSERSVLYNNRAAAKAKKGLKESALKDCTKAVNLNPQYFKALYRRAKLYEELEQLDKALADYKELSKLEPNNQEVKAALATLPSRIEEQTEKLKTEMFSKMKDLGNLFLRPFGLSTDNFQLNQDPVTGSYSINMTNSK